MSDHNILGTEGYGQLAQLSVASLIGGMLELRWRANVAIALRALDHRRRVARVGTDTYGGLPLRLKALD
jgi:hypothetical protein